MRRVWKCVGLGIAMVGCGFSPSFPVGLAPTVVERFDFRLGASGWAADFADYPEADEANFDLDSGIRTLPAELGDAGSGFLLSGNNASDDLFMFLKRRLGRSDGIRAGQKYRVGYRIVFASNAPMGCTGIGGAPGESVYLKAGASTAEPVAAANADGFIEINVDKGDQSEGGDAASVVSTIANDIACDEAGATPPYRLLEREDVHDELVTAGANGILWLLVGTDSGFEGTTALYYVVVDVELVPIN